MTIYAQGDILIERVKSAPSGVRVDRDPDGAVVLARGEATGHRHAIHGDNAVMFRDDGLARDLDRSLYIGHVVVGKGGADLRHEEHGTIHLPKGTYRIRRQREWDVGEARIVAD